MTGDKLYGNVLSTKLISNVSNDLLTEIGAPPNYKSIGILTCDIDDVTYTALDEATKACDVEIIYAKSMYAGSANASTKLAGEVIGIMAGRNPAEVKSGMQAAVSYINNEAHFTSANDDNSIVYYSHCISRTGTYLSKMCNIEEGEPLAYLIAPPLEAMYALDMALKASDVRMVAFYGPPTETNFAGALLTGTQSACKVACEAFAAAVCDVARNPKAI